MSISVVPEWMAELDEELLSWVEEAYRFSQTKSRAR